MASAAPVLPEGFELEAFLAPIEGDTPQGVDLREDTSAQSPWFRLRDARAEAREAERRAETDGGEEGGLAPAWRTINQLARAALLEKSKDLDIAAMLTEALLRMHGLSGLTAGALLIKGLAERYWDGVFPLPDEYDGIAARVAGVTGLSGAEKEGLLLPALRRLPLFRRPDGSSIAWFQVQGSMELATLDETRKEQRLKSGAIPPETLDTEARAAGQGSFKVLRDRLKDAQAAWGEMAAKLDELAGADGPSTGRVRDLLQEMLDFANKYAPAEEVDFAADEVAEVGESGAAEGGGGAPGAPRAASPGRSREDMLRQLVEIADYFKRTEPNSPLAYTLQDAVRRARLSWPELLEELVPDETARQTILASLGIKTSVG
ncbi:type VI secretion system protein TssA [Falsiroseomonas oryziterrae]|uniref:type VI secretion system protein TssA n=1 Tax=Falsiroseomonas oryziterrae TaxID=2911368 RepID=UPI001F3C5716|nr:type VI secretion system protein TssA [Roseomonas sp. NPKOSM-4]